ncbi:MAG: FtsX-like permease family protein, partial [Chitinophagaceae bacterium]
FILLIACINFINLTVARSVKRAKEIGIRKVVGGDRRQLILQFLGESFVLSMLAFLLALVLVRFTLPVFNELSNKKLAISYLADSSLIAAYISLFLLTGLMAGFYPAIVLSSYNPVQTLYSRFNLAGKNYLQKSLVVLQFGLASFLIMGTIVVYNQLHFLTNTDLGYDDQDLVVVNNGRHSLEEQRVFSSALMADARILNAVPKNGGNWSTVAKINGDKEQSFAFETIDEQYLPMMKIPLVQGRNFSKDFPSDSAQSVIINEAFAREAGWKKPLGQQIDFWYNNQKFNVVGVIKDHHFESLSNKIKPQVFRMASGSAYGKMIIKIQPGTATASLAHIEKVFKQLYPLNPYSYKFQNDVN